MVSFVIAEIDTIDLVPFVKLAGHPCTLLERKIFLVFFFNDNKMKSVLTLSTDEVSVDSELT